MFGVHWWVHLITVTALAMVFKEYRSLQQILHEEHRVKLWNSGPLPVSPGAFNMPMNPFQAPVTDETDTHSTEQEDNDANLDLITVIETYGSSVWCEGDSYETRRCKFKNVCFVPDADAIVFFRHRNSVTSNVPMDRNSSALLDMSSVSGHNKYYFNYVDIAASEVRRIISGNLKVLEQPTLLLKRFLPDNLMHVIHDDLMPVFATLQRIHERSHGSFDSQLIFMDSHGKGPYWSLYKALTVQTPMLKDDLVIKQPTCFQSLSVGLSKETVWYDYGFTDFQGPTNTSLDVIKLKQFTDHIKFNMNIQRRAPSVNQKRKLAVLLVRKENRLILNQNDLIAEIVALQFKVSTISLEDASIEYAIEQISQASLIIGMHGSLMILSMFAPPKSLVIELFPYAINPEHYTPYKTLLTLPGSDVTYVSWVNTNELDTVTHSDRPSRQGGISHLPEIEQNRIKSSNSVPKHKCCEDPEFLFRIYQDTKVDTLEIRFLIVEYFGKLSNDPDLYTSNTNALLKKQCVTISCTKFAV